MKKSGYPVYLPVLRAALEGSYVVADLETTGLNHRSNQILEMAALEVAPSGSVTRQFSELIRIDTPVPHSITQLTGITQADVDVKGRPLHDVLQEFLEFIGSRPVFFHNAAFDEAFIKTAVKRERMEFTNTVYDTLSIAEYAWPSLSSYSLANLARRFNASAPSHRALSDAKITLSVLLSAKDKIFAGRGAR